MPGQQDFGSTDQLYTIFQALYERLLVDPEQPLAGMVEHKLIIRLKIDKPDGLIVINARKQPPMLSLGKNNLMPELDFMLSGNTLHAILEGSLGLKAAMATGKIRANGPIWKTNALAGLFHQGRLIYPEIRTRNGFTTGQ